MSNEQTKNERRNILNCSSFDFIFITYSYIRSVDNNLIFQIVSRHIRKKKKRNIFGRNGCTKYNVHNNDSYIHEYCFCCYLDLHEIHAVNKNRQLVQGITKWHCLTNLVYLYPIHIFIVALPFRYANDRRITSSTNTRFQNE